MMAITEELGSSSEEEDDPTKHHVQKKVEQSPEPEFFNFLRSPRIDSEEPIPPGCEAWRAGKTTLFLLGS